MTAKKKEWLCALAAVFLLLVFLVLATRVMLPKRLDYGCAWNSYLDEEEDALDVLFVGVSYTYCGVNPAVVYQASGISSFDVTAPAMPTELLYYYAKEALKTQSPELMVVDVGAFFADLSELQSFIKVDVDYMPAGWNRLEAILCACPRSMQLGLLFPLYDYHTRWSELTMTDLTGAIIPPASSDIKGYTFLPSVYSPAEGDPTMESACYDSYTEGLDALKKLYALCAERDCEVLFAYWPGYLRFPEADMQALWDELTALCPGCVCVDFNDYADEIGLDWSEDLYDERHLSWSGAEKFSAWLGVWLEESYTLQHRGGTDWDAAIARYEALRSAAR